MFYRELTVTPLMEYFLLKIKIPAGRGVYKLIFGSKTNANSQKFATTQKLLFDKSYKKIEVD